MKDPNADVFLNVYDFWGYRIGIRSNSKEILCHFRSIYDRFFIGEQADCQSAEGQINETIPCIIEAIDNIANCQELLLSDGNESSTLRCKNLYEFDHPYCGQDSHVDPLASITYLFLKNKFRMIQKYQLFHAAAVSWDGRAFVLPALGGMGKTTLSVQLVKAGFKFLSDEVACIDPVRNTVKPYPRRLNISADSCALLGLPGWPDEFLRRSGTDETEWSIDIEQIVPESLGLACPLSSVIFLRGFGETARLESVSSSNALFKLFKYSFNSRLNAASQLYHFASVMDGVTCFSLVCGDPDKTAKLLVDLVDGRKASP